MNSLTVMITTSQQLHKRTTRSVIPKDCELWYYYWSNGTYRRSSRTKQFGATSTNAIPVLLRDFFRFHPTVRHYIPHSTVYWAQLRWVTVVRCLPIFHSTAVAADTVVLNETFSAHRHQKTNHLHRGVLRFCTIAGRPVSMWKVLHNSTKSQIWWSTSWPCNKVFWNISTNKNAPWNTWQRCQSLEWSNCNGAGAHDLLEARSTTVCMHDDCNSTSDSKVLHQNWIWHLGRNVLFNGSITNSQTWTIRSTCLGALDNC